MRLGRGRERKFLWSSLNSDKFEDKHIHCTSANEAISNVIMILMIIIMIILIGIAALQSIAPLIQRCVVVTRQVDGYGLTVTGDHPVYVHTVKPDGAAYRAGVRQGDKILKVNGMPVTASNHLEVVRMISGTFDFVIIALLSLFINQISHCQEKGEQNSRSPYFHKCSPHESFEVDVFNVPTESIQDSELK